MKPKINWTATLSNVVYQHKTDRVSVSVKDIESILSHIRKLEDDLTLTNQKIKNLTNEKNILATKLLVSKEKCNRGSSINDFMVYA